MITVKERNWSKDCSSVVKHLPCVQKVLNSIQGVRMYDWKCPLAETLESICQSELTLLNYVDQTV